MSGPKAACLYQETRLNLDPALPGSTIDVLVPANGATSFASRSSAKRRRLDRSSIQYGEETFSKLQLATESSIYFRPHVKGTRHHRTPQAILWRVLEDQLVLELQAVDLTQDQTEKTEPLLTLRFSFTDQIRPTGVAFAEENAEEDTAHRSLVVFVVTVTGQLFTLQLRRDAFVKPVGTGSLETENSDWCKSSLPSAFTYRTPYRLLSRNGKELWASLSDGSLVRFQRESINDRSWRETFFTESGWKATMRGLILWKPQTTIRYGEIDLVPSSASSIATSSDGKHIWTVCLDHTLRAWSVDSGRITFITDLTNENRDLQKPPSSLIDPANSQLIQIQPSKVDGEYFLVTFSPLAREFKFWHVKDVEAAEYGVEDMVPEFKFVPPIEALTDATVWTMESFHAKAPHTVHGHEWELWILVRSGPKCHTFSTIVNLNEHTDALNKAWRNKWSSVAPGLNTDEELRQSIDNPSDMFTHLDHGGPIGPVLQWENFLFYPGRFTSVTLETALEVYWNNLGRVLQSQKASIVHSSQPLATRICKTIELSASLARAADESIAYERYQRELASQWQIFYGAVRDLHKRRENALSLAYDVDQDISWLVMSGQIVPIRASSESEMLLSNRELFADSESLRAEGSLLPALEDPKHAEVAQLLSAVGGFRDSFPKHLLVNIQIVLSQEVLEGHGEDTDGLLQRVYDKSGLAGQVSDDDYNRLTDALEPLGGFAALDNDLFVSALGLLAETQKGHHREQQLTRYGARALIRGAQETLQSSFDMVFNLTILILFIGGELEEVDLPQGFDTHALFVALLQKLKELKLLCWLASTLTNERPSSAVREASSESTEMALNGHEHLEDATPATTLLESVFIGDWSSMPFPSGSESLLLTYWCRAWAFGARLSEQYDNIATHIMGTLLKGNDIELATEFFKFMPETRWSTYLNARLFLARGDFAESAIYFQTAAEDLALGRYLDIEQFDSANLLSAEERGHFNEGLPLYYQHIVTVFEDAGLPSYAAEFASLGLNAMPVEEEPHRALRSDLLSRLFTASLQTLRFQAACEALSQYSDLALLKSCLHQLLKTLLATPQGPKLLLTLPLPAPSLVDAYLFTLANSATPTFSSHSNNSTSLLHDPTKSLSSQSQPLQNPFKLLYAYRLSRSDLRGAASALYDRLQLLRNTRDGNGSYGVGIGGNDKLDMEVEETYLVLLNVMSLMDEEQAWILVRPIHPSQTGSAGTGNMKLSTGKTKNTTAQWNDVPATADPVTGKQKQQQQQQQQDKPKRRVVTLADVRKAWQEELDRRADVRAGRVPLFGKIGAGAGAGRPIPMIANGNRNENGYARGDGGEAMDVDVFG